MASVAWRSVSFMSDLHIVPVLIARKYWSQVDFQIIVNAIYFSGGVSDEDFMSKY